MSEAAERRARRRMYGPARALPATSTSRRPRATAVGLPRVVVMHVQVVFLIMTATALMTGTIKLRQNLASL